MAPPPNALVVELLWLSMVPTWCINRGPDAFRLSRPSVTLNTSETVVRLYLDPRGRTQQQ